MKMVPTFTYFVSRIEKPQRATTHNWKRKNLSILFGSYYYHYSHVTFGFKRVVEGGGRCRLAAHARVVSAGGWEGQRRPTGTPRRPKMSVVNRARLPVPVQEAPLFTRCTCTNTFARVPQLS